MYLLHNVCFKYGISAKASKVIFSCFNNTELTSVLTLFWISLFKQNSYNAKAMIALTVSNPAAENWAACATKVSSSASQQQY